MPRWCHRLYARFFGYFWLPCPICKEYFGGHESGGALMYSPVAGHCVCKKCTPEAEKRSAEMFGIATLR